MLIGINLLREGLDLPEVALVAILDADKEGFLRSETSLIQTTAGRRAMKGRVIFLRRQHTESIKRTIGDGGPRREKQLAYNAEHGIDADVDHQGRLRHRSSCYARRAARPEPELPSRRYKVEGCRRRSPENSFIFAGPTGVGKTEVAKALAEFLFGDEDALIQLDMSEYGEKHTVSGCSVRLLATSGTKRAAS